MKRFLLLFFSAVLVCSLMILPALAAETVVFQFDAIDSGSHTAPGFLPAGTYQLKAFSADDGGVLVFTSPDFVFDAIKGASIEFTGFDGETISIECYNSDDGFYFFGGACDSNNEECLSFSNFYSISYFEFVPVESEPVSPIAGIFGVFTGVGSWLAGQLGTTTSLFWNGQGLTFLGVLSVCALALAVVLLLVMVVVRFLRFRG